MDLVRVGRRAVVNLNYLILAEYEGAPEGAEAIPPGGMRITLETGRTLVLTAEESTETRARLDALLAERSPPVVLFGRDVDPQARPANVGVAETQG